MKGIGPMGHRQNQSLGAVLEVNHRLSFTPDAPLLLEQSFSAQDDHLSCMYTW